MVLTVSLLALGVFAVGNTLKSLVDVHLLPAAKLLGVLVLSASAVVPFATSAHEGALLGAGVFGLSTIFHGVHKTLEAAGDALRVYVLSKGLRR